MRKNVAKKIGTSVSIARRVSERGRELPVSEPIACTTRRGVNLAQHVVPAKSGTEKLLNKIQAESFRYFANEFNPENGLVPDKTDPEAPASVAAVGFALSTYPVAVERGFIRREEALSRVLTTLRFFANSKQSADGDATGYKGFYYHFLEMATGKRVWQSELSSIDTGIFLMGALTVSQYFNGDSAEEHEVRERAESLFRRVDWHWMQDDAPTITHGWTPEEGFLPHRWRGFNEGIILYILGLASPMFPLPPESYSEYVKTYVWRSIFDVEYLFAGPLFVFQQPQVWIDFRGIQDDYMRGKCIDYFENGRRATYVQRAYAKENPRGFKGYGENYWGITASDGPGPAVRKIGGVKREFFGYASRGVPDGEDDGTLSPWSTASSLPFAPEIVMPAIEHFDREKIGSLSHYGYEASINSTFPGKTDGRSGWVSKYNFAINQGPLILLVENFRSGLIWRLMRNCPWLTHGLQRAGFSGGWLGSLPKIQLQL